MGNTELQRAINAARQGEHQLAREMLRQLVIAEPDNELAWLWLAAIVQEDEKKLDCLRRVLQINPHNQTAIRGLRRIQAHIRYQQLQAEAQAPVEKPAAPPASEARKLQPLQQKVDTSQRVPYTPLFTFLGYLIRRLAIMLTTLFLITFLLYGVFVALVSPEARAMAYMPSWRGRGSVENFLENVIREHGFRDPFPVQYARWVTDMLHGDWGFSAVMNDDVIDVLLARIPATTELLLFSLLLFIPLGMISGVIAARENGRLTDSGFRLLAFISTSIPPFVLGLMLMAVFYIGVHWFSVGRVSNQVSILVASQNFKSYTHLLLLDGLLNGRLDVSLDVLRHMVLPGVTISVVYWATLGRVTRASMLEEMYADYVNTARAKGLSHKETLWRHAFRNALPPGLNSIALSAAMFLTNAVVIEIIFNYPGISVPLARSVSYPSPDFQMALGFTVFSVLIVLPMMFILDIAQAAVDPRIREEIN